MSDSTPRQRSLYLSSRLYELAAEFTEAELREALTERYTRSRPPAIHQAIRALIHLHRDADVEQEEKITSKERFSNRSSDEVEERAPSRQTSSLAALFADEDLFPSVGVIAEALQIPRRPKESRERYISRATKMMQAMTNRERAAVFDDLTKRINNRPDNFISKWSKLIKAL